jgi:lysophospholipase L1-like esterase
VSEPPTSRSAPEATFETDAANPVRPESRRVGARAAVGCIVLAGVLIALFQGPSIRASGERMDGGFERDIVLAVGKPAGWLGDRLPLADVGHDLTAWLSPDDELSDTNRFASAGASDAGGAQPGAVAPVGPEAFDPVSLGLKRPSPRPLRHLLVTGDSMTMPLDAELTRRLVGHGVKTERDPHIGTGLSNTDLLDWGALSAKQAETEPDAVVVFIGANEGFPLPGAGGKKVDCCGPDWAALYATRARLMMNTYRRGGATHVYWLTLPFPREAARQRIARAVNAAIAVAATPYRAQVRVLDMVPTFTPGGRYRAAMDVDGREELVRNADGIHLNERGAAVAAEQVIAALRSDFEVQ